MIFDRTTTAPCIIQPPTPPDGRCEEPDYALQHPSCVGGALILKPAVATLCLWDSLVFTLFEFVGGVETELTSGVSFASSDPTVFAIGVNSGSGTVIGAAIGAGTAIITATYGSRTVQATITAQPELTCCDETIVETAIVVDNSRSMSLAFAGYGSRLAFAKAAAATYGGLIAEVDGLPKDSVSVWSVNATLTALLAASQDTAAVLDAIDGITQTQLKTDLLTVFTVAAQGLLAGGADKPVLFLIGDCEQTVNADRQAILDSAFDFKQAGGIVVVFATRASGVLQGFDLAERIATPGYFINATGSNAAAALEQLAYLKKLLCAGPCVDAGDRYENQPALAYSFESGSNWEVVDGIVNLLGPGLMDFLPGNGLYVELVGQDHAVIGTIDAFDIVSGQTYLLHFKAAGNQQSQTAAQSISASLRIGPTNTFATNTKVFEQTVFPAWNDGFGEYNFTFTALADATVRLYFEQNYAGSEVPGSLLDDVLFRNETTAATLLADNFDGENLTYIPPACGGSTGQPAIDDPPAPEIAQVGLTHANVRAFFKYTYGYSWVTNEGETAVVPAVFTPSDTEHNLPARRVTMNTPPDRAAAIRLWRSLGEGHSITLSGAGVAGVDGVYTRTTDVLWDKSGGTEYLEYDEGSNIWRSRDSADAANYICEVEAFPLGPWQEDGLDPTPPSAIITYDADAGIGDLHLLIELPVSEVIYIDSESRDEFESRYEPSVTAPTVNTTEVAAGGLGYGYAPCCYYVNGSAFGDLIAPGDADSNPSVVVTGETLSGVSTDAYNACDGDTDTRWDGVTGSDIPAWWKCEFPEPKLISSYRITAETEGVSPPTEWVLEGSNDDSLWVEIDVQSVLAFDWDHLVAKSFDVTPVGSYKFFRFTFNALAASVRIVEVQLVGSTPSVFINNCPACLAEVPGLQAADSQALADIESGPTPPIQQTFNSTKCVSCLAGFANLPVFAGALETVIATNANRKLYNWDLAAGSMPVLLVLIGNISNGTTWILRGHTSSLAGTIGGGTVLQSGTSASFGWLSVEIASAGGFIHLQLDVTNPGSSLTESTVAASLSIIGPASMCASASSTVDQATADAAATAAAQLLLHCARVYSETVLHTSYCPFGTVGSATRPGTGTSYISQIIAHDRAVAAATAAADVALAEDPAACTGSNNMSGITIMDNTNGNPYPSVQYISGTGTIAKVVVTINGITHGSADDLRILLVSPEGTAVWLIKDCGGANSLSNVNLVFDDTGVALPDAAQITSGTYEPTIFGGNQYPPLPAPPQDPDPLPSLTLAEFIGEEKQGAWQLYVSDDLAVGTGSVVSWALTIV